jgi:hypothetical protein
MGELLGRTVNARVQQNSRSMHRRDRHAHAKTRSLCSRWGSALKRNIKMETSKYADFLGRSGAAVARPKNTVPKGLGATHMLDDKIAESICGRLDARRKGNDL